MQYSDGALCGAAMQPCSNLLYLSSRLIVGCQPPQFEFPSFLEGKTTPFCFFEFYLISLIFCCCFRLSLSIEFPLGLGNPLPPTRLAQWLGCWPPRPQSLFQPIPFEMKFKPVPFLGRKQKTPCVLNPEWKIP